MRLFIFWDFFWRGTFLWGFELVGLVIRFRDAKGNLFLYLCRTKGYSYYGGIINLVLRRPWDVIGLR